MRALERIANEHNVDKLRSNLELLRGSDPLVDLLEQVGAPELAPEDLKHLRADWFGEGALGDGRWWPGCHTEAVVRAGLIHGTDVLIRAIEQGVAPQVQMFWICTGEEVQVLTSFERDVLIWTVLTPPIPSYAEQAANAGPYEREEPICVTAPCRSFDDADGQLRAGLSLVERDERVATVRLLTSADASYSGGSVKLATSS